VEPRWRFRAESSMPNCLVLNRVLPALRRIRQKDRFTGAQSVRKQWNELQWAADPLTLWLEIETISSQSSLASQDELHAAYTRDCLHNNKTIMTKQMFGCCIKRLRPELKEVQRTSQGRKRWMYLGIEMRNANDRSTD
jgi:hypothetical protein